ncbi:MAG: S8 family serine peptidase [Candidatus Eremiobacteraeota bacterium]|nr:S8 family serine peptidase [Candidatus Eremiobacteraeota bacterium]
MSLFGPLDPNQVLAKEGEGVKVGIIDTGLDLAHPDLAATLEQVKSRTCFLGGAPRPDPDATDPANHGTPVTWLIHQLAPRAELHHLRALARDRRGSARGLAAALAYALEQNFQVINLSLGLERFEPAWKARFVDLVDRAYYAGTILVASASNRSDWILPGSLSALISVDMDFFADPLAVRPRGRELLLYGPKPHIWLDARGTMVKAPKAGSREQVFYTGTSYAAPHVTGIVARLLSTHPELEPFEVKTVLHHLRQVASEAAG